jgi:predicted ABC-type ATPase
MSEERVAMRVLQGGHDVPPGKLKARFPRTLANLQRAVQALPHVLVYDNGDLARPFRKVAEFDHGKPIERHAPVPAWLARIMDGPRPQTRRARRR